MPRKTKSRKSAEHYDMVEKTGSLFLLDARYISRAFAPEKSCKHKNQPRRTHGTRKTL